MTILIPHRFVYCTAFLRLTNNHLVLIQRKQQKSTMIQNDFPASKKWGLVAGHF